MTDTNENHGAGRFIVKTTSDSHFSWIRTRLSLERTMMSWARTAVALIGFGFTIVQFFEHFSDFRNVEPALRPEAPRYLGLALIAAGIISLLISIIQYHLIMNYLWQSEFSTIAGLKEKRIWTPILAACILLVVIGVLAFVTVLFRLL